MVDAGRLLGVVALDDCLLLRHPSRCPNYHIDDHQVDVLRVILSKHGVDNRTLIDEQSTNQSKHL